MTSCQSASMVRLRQNWKLNRVIQLEQSIEEYQIHLKI